MGCTFRAAHFLTKKGMIMANKIRTIHICITKDVLDRYDQYYFSIHKQAKKSPIPRPYHESINKWMIMKRPAMNGLKQKWKSFIEWFVEDQGYSNLRINKCEIRQLVYYPTSIRHDVDNSVPKFILDGLVESGMIEDDDCSHIFRLTLECGVDRENPRTELEIIQYE